MPDLEMITNFLFTGISVFGKSVINEAGKSFYTKIMALFKNSPEITGQLEIAFNGTLNKSQESHLYVAIENILKSNPELCRQAEALKNEIQHYQKINQCGLHNEATNEADGSKGKITQKTNQSGITNKAHNILK